MSSAAIRARAAEIIASESAWCQKAIARKSDGTPCGPLSDLATSWDLYGSMVKAMDELGYGQRDLNEADAFLRDKYTTSNTDTDFFNDENSHAAVIAIIAPGAIITPAPPLGLIRLNGGAIRIDNQNTVLR